MSPSRRVLTKALALGLAAAALVAGAARAQFYDPALRSLDLVTDVARSPRLQGMGGLSLVIPDRDNRITLWDFANSPLGAFGQDSTGSMEIRPSAGSASDVHGMPTGFGERQHLAGRTTSLQFESFYRDHKASAYGAVGVLNSLRRDAPYSDGLEQRRAVGLPEIMPIFNGAFPYFGGGRLRYALRLRFGGEHQLDQYRTITTNPNGQFLSLDGTTVPTPVFFVPDEYRVNTSGIGAGLSYALGTGTVLALGMDAVDQRIKGSNNSDRYSAERREKRPYTIGQASIIGRLGEAIEYGVDGRAWRANSEESWYFTISAGVGADPLVGRGKLLEREEEGSALRSRVRVTAGNLELGGGFWTRASKVGITPPDNSDPTSFNRFLNQVYYRQNADSLAMPDSVVANEIREYAWGYGVGASLRGRKTLLGAEFHWSRDLYDEWISGLGPRSLAWDVRAGLEYACTSMLTGRLGYGYRWWDRDDFVRQNEFKGNSASMGLGVHPSGTSWSFEGAWTFAWHQSDFGDPTLAHGTRQRVSSQVRWDF
ncbi:MAG: hypothetical protein IT347_06000 [Candidatus Eisenbacteria bacterium]|nr:hypothetical protein [Candidatus Eisenbacteria bacterium]